MKSLLVIPDGVGIRNFLFGQFVDLLLSRGEVVAWHVLPERSIQPYRESGRTPVRWEPLPVFREGPTERILRQAKVYAQLYWRFHEDASEVTLGKLRRPVGTLANRLLALAAYALGRVLGNQRGVVWLDRLHALATLRAGYLEKFAVLLRQEQPDVVFCTHQRASRAVPAMLAARKLGIPTATFIYSWDNLPKGRMAVHADHYLVWSDYMKAELLRYYPELAADRVHVVGTPQFEHYFNRSLVQPRELFLRSVGLDPSRPVVCFSGDDVATSPYDPIYLADLADALRRLPSARRPQLLFRRSPVDSGSRYRWVLEKYPEIAVSEPRWLTTGQGDWTQVVPTPDDVALLVNVVHHCDAVVNLGSTMAMDFAVLGKPGIYVAYNPPSVDGWDIHELYKLPHLRCVHALQPVYWARSPEQLGDLVLHALRHPREKAAARHAWLDLQVKQPMDQASERCGAAVVQIANAPKVACTSPS